MMKRVHVVAVCLAMSLAACGNSETDGPERCSRNSDCANTDATCVEGLCRLECVNDRDCADGTFCEGGVCLEGVTACRADEDCLFNQTCQQGICANIEGFCERTRDCPEAQACSAVTHRCVDIDDTGGECGSDRDCFAEERCVRGRCAPRDDVECVVDGDCDATEICLAGRCEPECVEDRDCERGFVCDRGQCEADDPDPDPNPNPEPDPGPVCGDGDCDGGEDAGSCPQDCGGDCSANPGLCSPSEECCGRACVPRGSCPSDYWQICDAGSDCSSTLCIGDPTTMPPVGHCTERCGVRGDCPQVPASLCISQQNIVTNQPGGSQLIGLCFADDTGNRCSPLGANNCFDGICIDRRPNNQVEGQCSLRCLSSADCLPGYACGPKEFDVQGQATVINVCVPVGEACQGTGIEAANQCYSGICVTDDQNNNLGICTTLCANNAVCPSAWSCVPVDEQNSICLPQ